MSAEKLYDHGYYDSDYYNKGARGGFHGYEFHSPIQREQLALKWDACRPVPHDSALFVGCARGFEVAHWFGKGINAAGVDVSTWAIQNQIPEARGECSLYDGLTLPFPDSGVDLVACFDVLPHLPDDQKPILAAEMVRVARRGIVWRQIVKNWRNHAVPIDGRDGSFFHYLRFEEWDRLFTESGKFRLETAKWHSQYEVTAVFLPT
jgi:SAM-dependent methyltransferase